MANGLTTTGEQSLSVRNATELIPAIEKYGAMIAKGQLFGCKNAEQGQTLVLMSMSEGIPVTEMRRRYHIINGSDLSLRADWMLAEFERQGGWWVWLNEGDDGVQAVMHVKYKHHDTQVKYTIDMAKRAGLCKPKSGWEKNPGEMLRARCQTKAIRMLCPNVLAGFATDQELDADAVDVEYQIDNSPDRAEPPVQATEAQAVASPADGPSVDDSSVVDAEFTVATEAEPEKATGQQMETLMSLFKQLGMPAEVQLKAFVSTGATTMADLTVTGADQIITKLETAVKSQATSPTVTETATAACSTEQAEKLKSLIQQLAQSENGVAAVQQLKAHMDQSGLAKFADLNADEATALMAAIESKDFSTIYANPFVGTAKKE